jgi:transcriptional regulator with XRE-family HTH domain
LGSNEGRLGPGDKLRGSDRGDPFALLLEQRQRVGPAIRHPRQQPGLSLLDLAQRTGISLSYLSRLEKGKSDPSFTLLSRIGQELGVPISFFVETEQDAQKVNEELLAELSQTTSPESVWSELLGMSLEGRKAIEYLKQQVPAWIVPKASAQHLARRSGCAILAPHRP